MSLNPETACAFALLKRDSPHGRTGVDRASVLRILWTSNLRLPPDFLTGAAELSWLVLMTARPGVPTDLQESRLVLFSFLFFPLKAIVEGL